MPAQTRPTAKSKSAAQAGDTDFAGAFAGLKRIMRHHTSNPRVLSDKPGDFSLETRAPSFRGKPLYCAGARIHKNYVSYYLMPLYINTALLKRLSPDLKKRMQGKCCFNFSKPEPALFRELDQLTAAGFEDFRKKKFL